MIDKGLAFRLDEEFVPSKAPRGKYVEFLKKVDGIAGDGQYFRMETLMTEQEILAVKQAIYNHFPKTSKYRVTFHVMKISGTNFNGDRYILRFAKILR
jgi:hypothetical protein